MYFYDFIATTEFNDWLDKQSKKDQRVIDSRLSNIKEFRHFGDCKNVGENLLELRWKNGRRIYFSLISNNLILLLIGGLKNGQKKDIKKANILLQRYPH